MSIRQDHVTAGCQVTVTRSLDTVPHYPHYVNPKEVGKGKKDANSWTPAFKSVLIMNWSRWYFYWLLGEMHNYNFISCDSEEDYCCGGSDDDTTQVVVLWEVEPDWLVRIGLSYVVALQMTGSSSFTGKKNYAIQWVIEYDWLMQEGRYNDAMVTLL